MIIGFGSRRCMQGDSPSGVTTGVLAFINLKLSISMQRFFPHVSITMLTLSSCLKTDVASTFLVKGRLV